MPSAKKMFGGRTLAALLGALLLSWFVNIFFIYPYIGYGTYTLNFATFLNLLLALQLPAITFLLVTLLIWWGYIGATMARSKGAIAMVLVNPMTLVSLPVQTLVFLGVTALAWSVVFVLSHYRLWGMRLYSATKLR
jgi:hypothetical protein